MESEIICLQELYSFIERHSDIPHRTKDKKTYKPFKILIEKSILNVPEKTGWYCWVDNRVSTKPVYIGKSDSNTTYNLYKRIEEELSEEYVALWATVYDEDETLYIFNSKYNNKYINNNLRAVKKKGVTHVFWVSTDETLDKQEIETIETKLIQYYNPVANKQKKNCHHDESKLFKKVLNKFSSLLETLEKNKANNAN